MGRVKNINLWNIVNRMSKEMEALKMSQEEII